MRKLYPLTDEERDFATENYEIVTRFLRKKRLPESEYYDVVIFGFLEAVQTQFRNPCEIEKQNFAVLAHICMKHAMGEDRKYRKRKMRCGNPLSMDCPIVSDSSDDFNFYDIVPDITQNPAQQVENQEIINLALCAGSPRERVAIGLVCRGFEPYEVSEIMGITRLTSRTTLYHFRKKARMVVYD